MLRDRDGKPLKLTSLPEIHRREVLALHKISGWQSSLSYLRTWAAIAILIALQMAWQHWLLTVLVVVGVGARQAQLYVLNHDASHLRQYQSPVVSRWVGFLVAVVPLLHHPETWSFAQWRRRHRYHHHHLFTPLDPDWKGRAARGDTTRVYSFTDILRSCVHAGLTSSKEFFIGKQDGAPSDGGPIKKNAHHHLRGLFLAFDDDSEMERERRIKLACYAIFFAGVAYAGAWSPLFWCWIVPMYTVYPAILRFHDLTEHRWREPSTRLQANSRAIAAPLWLRILLGCGRRPLHFAHHAFPGVPVHRLHRLYATLASAGLTGPASTSWSRAATDSAADVGA